jgi:hypothetical protein
VTAAMAMGAIGAAILLIAYKVRPIGVDQA